MKITVIIPVCDAPIGSGRPHYFLKSCLQSVIDGGHDDFECLVGCDGDTPAIKAIVDGFGDPRMRYFAFSRTRSWGNFQCHELLEKHATGDVVMWMNHDDCYVPGALRMAAEEVEAFPGRPIFFRALLRCGVVIWVKRDVRRKMNVHVLATVTPRTPDIPPYGISAERDSAEDWKWVLSVHDLYVSKGKPPIWCESVLLHVRPWAPPEIQAWHNPLEASLFS